MQLVVPVDQVEAWVIMSIPAVTANPDEVQFNGPSHMTVTHCMMQINCCHRGLNRFVQVN